MNKEGKISVRTFVAHIDIHVSTDLEHSVTDDVINGFIDKGYELDITKIKALDKDLVTVNIQVWCKDDEKSIQKPRRVF